MVVTLKDGAVLSGTARQIVTAMREGSWTAPTYPDNAAYKRAVSARVEKWCGRSVRTAFDVDFLRDLHHLGFIVDLQERLQ